MADAKRRAKLLRAFDRRSRGRRRVLAGRLGEEAAAAVVAETRRR
ncbi:MAG: hypothetical protein V3V67_14000 [Myxococcota bacterium]